MLINRFRQFYLYFFRKYREEDDKLAKKYLDQEGYLLFFNMSRYDKLHSLNVLKNVLKSDIINKNIFIKLSLLHDIGKSSDISFYERFIFVLFKKNKILENHAEKGYELLKENNKEIAELIRDHHNKDSDNEIIKKFIQFDEES